MEGAGRQAERFRKEARGFARDALRAARRHRRRLGEAREAIDAAAGEVHLAAEGDDAERLSGALQRLDGLWDQHLAPLQPPLARRVLLLALSAILVALAARAFVVEALGVSAGSMVPTLHAGDRVLVWKPAYGLRIPIVGARPFGASLPRRGDVVAVAGPRGEQWIRRVVGLPGDVVEIREQVLLVNGVPQPRSAAGELAYEERDAETGVPWQDTCRAFVERLAVGPLRRPESPMPVDAEARWTEAAAWGERPHRVLQCRRVRPGSSEGPWEPVPPGHVFVLGDNRDRSPDSRAGATGPVPLARIQGRAALVAWGGAPGGGPRLDRLFKVVE